MGWSVAQACASFPRCGSPTPIPATLAASVLLFLHVVAGYAVLHREPVSAILLSRLLIPERSNVNA